MRAMVFGYREMARGRFYVVTLEEISAFPSESPWSRTLSTVFRVAFSKIGGREGGGEKIGCFASGTAAGLLSACCLI